MFTIEKSPLSVSVRCAAVLDSPIDMYNSGGMSWEEAQQYAQKVSVYYDKIDAELLAAGFTHPAGRDNIWVKHTGAKPNSNLFTRREMEYFRNGEHVATETLLAEAEIFASEAQKIIDTHKI